MLRMYLSDNDLKAAALIEFDAVLESIKDKDTIPPSPETPAPTQQ